MGSGIGSIPLDRLVKATGAMLQAAMPGGFKIAATPVPLADVEQAWPRDDSIRRTVFFMDGRKPVSANALSSFRARALRSPHGGVNFAWLTLAIPRRRR
jgi:hypothetical protein